MQARTFYALDARNLPMGGAKVRVQVHETQAIASVFDDVGAELEQPLVADARGAVRFAAPNGAYDLIVAIAADEEIIQPKVLFFDPEDMDQAHFARWDEAHLARVAGRLAEVFTVGPHGYQLTESSDNPTGFGAGILPLAASGQTVSLAQFGAALDGVGDDAPALDRAAVWANQNALTLVGAGRAKLLGDVEVTLTCDCDFSGLVFDASDWEGVMRFGRSFRPVTYRGDHWLVANLLASPDLSKGSSKWDGWGGLREVRDAFVMIYTDQPFYSYRGKVVKRVEMNRGYRDGVMASPLRYDLTGVGIEKVVVYPMEPRRRRVAGLTIDIGDNDASNSYVIVETSLLDIEARFLQGGLVTANPTLISFEWCCAVRARLDFQYPNKHAEGRYTYNLSMKNSYDLDITPHGAGEGWGATGSNFCQRVTFRDGALSRVDFHRPFVEWLKLRDMVVGDWGVLVTALGDLDIENTIFNARNVDSGASPGVLRSRTDTGGFADGHLRMRNITIVADAGSGDRQLIQHNAAAGNPKPIGSPIDYRWWRSITVDDLTYQPAGADRLVIAPLITDSDAAPMKVAETITLRDLDGPVALDMDTTGVLADGNRLSLRLDAAELAALSITGDGPAITGTYSHLVTDADVTISARGNHALFGGRLNGLDLGQPAHPVALRAVGALISTAVTGENPNTDYQEF